MKEYTGDKIRNVAIVGHGGAGTTSVTEALLFRSGAISRMCKVEDGQTTTDYEPEEIKRGVSVNATLAPVEWRDTKINFIDTPGFADFVAEVKGAFRAVDSALIVVCATSGVQVGTEQCWKLAEEAGLPRIIFVNKMDRSGADFFGVVSQIKERLGANPIPLVIPIGQEDLFKGVVDLIANKALIWDEESNGQKFIEVPMPEDLKDIVAEYRQKLVEGVAEENDALMEKFFEDPDSITEADIIDEIRKATLQMKIVPVLCGSSFKNKGVQTLLDSVCAFLPSPLDTPEVEGINPKTENEETRPVDVKAPFSALAFKIATDPYVGRLCFFRVYSGSLESGSYVYNANTGKKERISRIMQMHSNKQNPIDRIEAGDIAAAVGFKDIKTGNTLCDEHHPIVLESMKFPEPVISIAVEPMTTADTDKMENALLKLAEEDPTFRVKTDEVSGQTIISGMGELHLDIIVDRMRREFGVEVNQGRPEVAYKEAITTSVQCHEVFKKQTGGKGKFADILFELGPADEGFVGLQFINEVKGGNIPKEYMPAIEKGFKEAMLNGVLAGYPMDSMKVRVIDGSFHPVDSDQLSFELCAKIGFKNACRKANPVLLEPMMKLEVLTPDAYVGDVTSDLNRRRGILENISAKVGVQAIRALVPLERMFGYVTALRTITSGRANSTMEFSNYAEVTKDQQEAILKNKGAL